jgi:uncharacterized protein
MRVALWVKLGSSRPRVGGSHGSALVVAVSAHAVEGRATETALAAVAHALGVRRSAVRLVSGRISREKLVEVDAPDEAVRSRLEALLRS